MIEVKGLCFRYPQSKEDSWALEHLDLSIKPGEYVAVLGRNGSGKSTLARHLNAMLLPDRGRVLVDGMVTTSEAHLWQIRQRVGMVFQNPDNQIVASVVEEDVAFGPENLGVEPAEIRSRVQAALAAVGIEQFAKREPHLLSGGQKQRVAIAGVLAMRPRYLVLDEPTAMLDPNGRREVMHAVLDLNRREGLSVVHITHFMEEAALADRVLVMEGGKIAMAGSPYTVFSQVEQLKSFGLDVPQMAELKLQLQQRGLNLPGEVLTLEEMVDALCALN